MRWVYAVFRSRTQALDCAARLQRGGVGAAAVSAPREANAGCGLAVRFAEDALPRVRREAAQAGYSAFVGFYRVGAGCVQRIG